MLSIGNVIQPTIVGARAISLPILSTLICLVVIGYIDSKIWHGVAILALSATWFAHCRNISKRHLNDEVSQQNTETQNTTQQLGDITTQFEHILDSESAQINQDLERIETLLSDSIEILQSSFSTVTESTEHQNALANKLVSKLTGGAEDSESFDELIISDFITETDRIIQFYVDLLVEVSSSSVGAVYKIDDLNKSMDDMFSILDEVQKLAKKTNLLALNAAIEAARAGEAGRGFAVVADEVRSLSESSATLNEDIRIKVEQAKLSMIDVHDEVAQIAQLDLNEAISGKSTIDSMLEKVDKMNHSTNEITLSLQGESQKIQVEIGRAIRALQFEDIVSQLSGHIQERIIHINQVIDVAHPNKLLHSKSTTILDSIAKKLTELRDEFSDKKIEKKVEQNSMEEGDVELF